MLKHRLIFGALMTVFFIGFVLLDGWLDGSLTASDHDKPVQATVLMILVVVALSLGAVEASKLVADKPFNLLLPASVIGIVLISTAWYWSQVIGISLGLYLPLALALVLAGLVVQQHIQFGPAGILVNCGVSSFFILYLGLLGAFFLGIRIDIGLWELLAFVFVVKSSDIGAYTFGRLFGVHKLAPRVSPGKTWEGLAGAMVVAMLVSFAFAAASGIMSVWLATIFGGGMAVAGQLSDLTESMLKRDARQKDSSNRVPGFGGILDVIDSLLLAAPLAYVFFRALS